MEELKKILGRAGLRHSLLIGTVALAVGIAVSFEAHTYFSQAKIKIDEPRYMVANRPLPVGHPIQLLDLGVLVRAQVKGEIPSDALTDQQAHWLKGAILKQSVGRDEVLSVSALQLAPELAGLGAAIPKGFRAYSFHPGNSPSIRPGDRVDIFLNPTNPKSLPVNLVEGASVLQFNPIPGHPEVIVALRSSEITFLERAQQIGTLTLALRNPEEGVPRFKAAHRSRLLRPGQKKPTIEVWAEGD